MLASATLGLKLPDLDVSPILRGGIVATTHFLPPQLIQDLRSDALSLFGMGEFVSSGLSNTAQQQQGFGKHDRQVRAITPDLEGDREARRDFDRHLDELREHIGASLNRSLICAEQYYSVHGPGAYLTRHMDERHEELKGARGWATSNRRSISWLLYLSAGGWDTDEAVGSGGAYRGYCRSVVPHATTVGAHNGNIQVGWLTADEDDGIDCNEPHAAQMPQVEFSCLGTEPTSALAHSPLHPEPEPAGQPLLLTAHPLTYRPQPAPAGGTRFPRLLGAGA